LEGIAAIRQRTAERKQLAEKGRHKAYGTKIFLLARAHLHKF
jgi:hypothetical protein